MKDFQLIKYLAKLSGAKPKRSKTFLYCYFSYGDAVMPVYVSFKRGKSVAMLFDLSDVYETYGQKYGSYRKFCEAYLAEHDYFSLDEVGDKPLIYSDITQAQLKNTVSQALSRITIMCYDLNQMLGLNIEYLTEEDWRDLHRCYLDKQKKVSLLASLGSVATFVLSIVFMCLILSPSGGAEGAIVLLLLLLALLLPVSLISAVVFFIRYKHFKKHLQWSLNSRGK